MTRRRIAEEWIRGHRGQLLSAWVAIGAVGFAWVMLRGPEFFYVRGAPLPRGWFLLFLASLWAWVALRFIALWIWAWVVMALAPVFLFLPLRFYLDAWWLLPLLAAITVVSLLTVAVVVTLQLRRRASGA